MVIETVSPIRDVIDIVKGVGGEAFRFCYQCGLCNTACPWNTVKNFNVRRLVREAQFGLVDFESDDMWRCVTCRACVARCPRGVEIIDVMRAFRRAIVDLNVAKIPDSLRVTIKNISAVGNPLGEPPEKRADWAKDLNVKTHVVGTEVLYFPCCITEYVPAAQRIARATVNLLQKASVDFGILGNKASCCGESVRKAGQEPLFQSLAQSNISAFSEAGVKKIVVSSPHCYNAFKNEYRDLGGNFEVVHVSQYLAGLIKQGKLKPTKPANSKVAYHDPCYLGRHNGIYDAPREVLKSIPGLELVEMRDFRETSMCCGGGGGGIWLETKKGERLSDARLEQATEVQASTLALGCPYCMLNFDDSVLTTNQEGSIKVKDISELLQEAL